MAKSSKLKLALVKLEATYGTDPAPTAAADGVFISDINVTPLDITSVDRTQIRPFFGSFRKLVAGKMARLSISMEIAGFGTAGPASPTAGYDALLQSAGLARTVTAGTSVAYTPVSTGLKSVTVYYYIDGLLQKFTGCYADKLSMSFKRNGVPVYTFELLGLYAGTSDAAIVTPTLTAYQTPYIVNVANTTLENFLGTATGICLESLDVAIDNQVVYRNLVNCTEQMVMVDRTVTGSAVVELMSVAIKDIWSLALASTLSALQLTHGAVGGNKVRFSSANTDVKNPQFSNDNNIELLSCDLTFPAVTGGDDFAITVL